MQMPKRVDWRAVACLILPFALMVGAHFLFRFLYYGELLPNTYYAKFVRPWWDMGLRYYAAAGLETGLYLLVPLAAAGAWMRWRTSRDGIYGLVLLCVVLHSVYVMRVGGDFFEWRPLDFYWPLLAVPAADAIVWLGVKLASGVKKIVPALSRFLRLAPVTFTLCIFALVLFYSSAMQFALLLRAKETVSWAGTLNMRLDRHDAGWLFAAPGMSLLYRVNEELRMEMAEHYINLRLVGSGNVLNHTSLASYEDALRGKMPEDAVMVISILGLNAYYLADITVIDYYGLTDKTVARNPVLHSNDERRMAHDRSPSYGYLNQRGVNISILPSARSEAEALDWAGYALQLGEGLWMPFNAIDRQWVQDSFGGSGLASARDGTSAIDVMNDLVRGRDPEIRSGFYDVHVVGNSVVYVKSPCIWDDVQHPLYLHVIPASNAKLPTERQAPGFYELSFDFWDRDVAADPDACVARVDLPGYEIASVRTGQLTLEGNELWSGAYSFAAAEIVEDLRRLQDQSRQPDIASLFDVFVDSDSLIYVKGLCYQQDIDTRFFLHVIPADVDDLPADRRESGFDNLDFNLSDRGGLVGDECVARVELPEYEIASIRTGQYTPEGSIWDASINMKQD